MTTDTRTAHAATAGRRPRTPADGPHAGRSPSPAASPTSSRSPPRSRSSSCSRTSSPTPPAYISNPGSNAAVQWGSVLEILTAASGVATAVILYPVTRRVSRTAAIGFVTSRVVEAALILVGVVSILVGRDPAAALRRRHRGAGSRRSASPGSRWSRCGSGRSCSGRASWPGVNDLLLGYILYRSGLVGRVIPIFGLVGGPLILRVGHRR